VHTATVHLRFYAELGDLLSPERRGTEFAHVCATGSSVKDVIESLGVPHTEVDLLLVNGASAPLTERLEDGDRVSVYPVFEALDIAAATLVRPVPLRHMRFAADVHLGRLAGYLRLGGFDSSYRNDWADKELADVASSEHRVLLTRDRGLLMRAVVTHGYLVRSQAPRAQLREVLERFDLWGSVAPFSRCSLCNGMVAPVAKKEVEGLLRPRTAESFHEFWRCQDCGQVYWRGAHYESLLRLFDWDGRAGACETPTGKERDAHQGEHPHRRDTH
jgi:uncharacterized protein